MASLLLEDFGREGSPQHLSDPQGLPIGFGANQRLDRPALRDLPLRGWIHRQTARYRLSQRRGIHHTKMAKRIWQIGNAD